MRVRWKKARSQARSLWRKHGSLVATPVEKIAESQGLKVVRRDFKELDVSGALIYDGSLVYAGINSRDSKACQRFTLAHQIGHYKLHPKVDRFEERLLRNSKSSEVTSCEIEANVFAAELLMPASDVKRRVGSAREFIREDLIRLLASVYKVSVLVMTVRLVRLGVIQA